MSLFRHQKSPHFGIPRQWGILLHSDRPPTGWGKAPKAGDRRDRVNAGFAGASAEKAPAAGSASPT